MGLSDHRKLTAKGKRKPSRVIEMVCILDCGGVPWLYMFIKAHKRGSIIVCNQLALKENVKVNF